MEFTPAYTWQLHKLAILEDKGWLGCGGSGVSLEGVWPLQDVRKWIWVVPELCHWALQIMLSQPLPPPPSCPHMVMRAQAPAQAGIVWLPGRGVLALLGAQGMPPFLSQPLGFREPLGSLCDSCGAVPSAWYLKPGLMHWSHVPP